MTDGYQALHETVALLDLSSRGRIKVTGDDRARLLHAMTTNDVKSLTPGTGCYAFFLNAQGRILADANILCFEDHLLLDVEPESRTFLLEHLDKYIIADDVALEDVTASTSSFGIEGPQAYDGSLPVPQAPLAHLTHLALQVIRVSFTGAPGLRIIGDPSCHASCTPQDAKAVRLENFFPRFGDDIGSANLPQETGITDALHFNKGCYLGQEIVERVRSRGHVNRILTGLRIEGDQILERGEKILFEGAEVGEVSSAAWSPAFSETRALGYVRMPAAKPGNPLSIGGRAAQCAAIKSSRS